MNADEAKQAHDALLALRPDGAHECDLCSAPTTEREVAVADDRTYTETEHEAIMTEVVRRETADLTTAKATLETQVSELTAKVDVLEAEKAALETKVSETEKAHEELKNSIERDKEIAAAKTARVEAIKKANDKLPDTYFTDERVLAWAEMEEATFQVVLDGISATAGTPAGKARESAAFRGGEEPKATKTTDNTVGRFLAVRNGWK